jgi:hypothetical protein
MANGQRRKEPGDRAVSLVCTLLCPEQSPLSLFLLLLAQGKPCSRSPKHPENDVAFPQE